MFNDFVRFEVLPYYGHFEIGHGLSVSIVDSASIYQKQELVEMLDEPGVESALIAALLTRS